MEPIILPNIPFACDKMGTMSGLQGNLGKAEQSRFDYRAKCLQGTGYYA
jgi:hypothetical protein